MRRFALIALLVLSGCDTTNSITEQGSEYLPLVGERCQNFQCFNIDMSDDGYMPTPYNGNPTEDGIASEGKRKRFPAPQTH